MSKSVFVSSTSKDLETHRLAVKDVLLDMGVRPIMQEHFPSMTEDAVNGCKKLVESSDLFVGVYAYRYGYVPDGYAKSITELEYEWAAAKGIPIHTFLVDPTYVWPDDSDHREQKHPQAITDFKVRIEKEHIRRLFTTPESLAIAITTSIANDVNRLSREQARQRRFFGIIAGVLILLLVGIIAAIIVFANPDETAQADREATNQAINIKNQTSMAALWTPTPTSTPQPLPPNTFNVVVAGFAAQGADGSVFVSPEADEISDLVYASLQEFPTFNTTQEWQLLDWRQNGVGRILESDSNKRQQAASEIAQRLNADVVIYGLVQSDQSEFYLTFAPEFYVSASYAALEPEMEGSGALGPPVDFLRDDNSQSEELQQRLAVIELFLSGLASYYRGEFDIARQQFENALTIEPDGLEVLYVLAGNAAVRNEDLTTALELYNDALEHRPTYARALIGRGNALLAGVIDLNQSVGNYDSNLALPSTTTCITDPSIEPQLVVEQAVLCFEEAASSPDQLDTADIDVKAEFGMGQVYTWMQQIYRQGAEEAATHLQGVLELYEQSDEVRQDRIRQFAAVANAWLGLNLISQSNPSDETLLEAITYYEAAIELLQRDINRAYNQDFIEAYTRQLDRLRKAISTPLPSSPSPLPPTLTPSPEATI